MIRIFILSVLTGFGLVGVLMGSHRHPSLCDRGFVGKVWPSGSVTCTRLP